VSEAVYNKLKEIAERRGFSTLADTIAYLVTLEEEILRRLDMLTNSISISTANGGRRKTSPDFTSTINNGRSNDSPKDTSITKTSSTRTFCRDKSEIRNIERYVKWLKENNKLIDWWDEETKYCFEVKE
jgi:hypothetical protein